MFTSDRRLLRVISAVALVVAIAIVALVLVTVHVEQTTQSNLRAVNQLELTINKETKTNHLVTVQAKDEAAAAAEEATSAKLISKSNTNLLVSVEAASRYANQDRDMLCAIVQTANTPKNPKKVRELANKIYRRDCKGM